MDVHFVKRFPTVEEGRQPKSVYLERAPGQRYMVVYVTLENPELFSSTVSHGTIGEMIAQAITKSSGSYFVDNIEARDAIVNDEATRPGGDAYFVVADASADPNLQGPGGMMYYYVRQSGEFRAMCRINHDPYTIVSWNELAEKPPFGEETTPEGKKILTYAGSPVGNNIVENPTW